MFWMEIPDYRRRNVSSLSLTPQVVNSIGLAANIAGVGLAFFFGYPQPSHEEGNALVFGKDPEVPVRRARYLFWSRIGLGLMTLGFVLQLVATWMAHS